MKKSILIYGIIGLAVVALIVAMPKDKKTDKVSTSTVSCSSVCDHLKNVCGDGSVVTEDCLTVCETWNDEIRQAMLLMDDCEFLLNQIENQAQVLAEQQANQANPNAAKCDQACNNYVSRCLTLVPNATPALFEEGFQSCKQECASWPVVKIDCMVSASSCEAFTDVCGL